MIRIVGDINQMRLSMLRPASLRRRMIRAVHDARVMMVLRGCDVVVSSVAESRDSVDIRLIPLQPPTRP